jgi:hypothetical protein
MEFSANSFDDARATTIAEDESGEVGAQRRRVKAQRG